MSDEPKLLTERPERLMVIVAHPDDADFGPAATVARWIDEGTVAELVCCTSGDAGSDDPETDPVELAVLRETEQRAAAEVVGYRAVHFLHQPDGALENDLALREELVRLIREMRPDAVMTPDPTQVFVGDGMIQHTDHRTAGLAAVDAVYPAARNAMAFAHLAKSGLAPHVVRRIYLFWTDHPTEWVDVSACVDRKLLALHAHRSQLRDPAGIDQRVRERMAEQGAAVGVEAADAFRVIRIER
ncbi:MAG: PIG-L family deacetylase [Chloroflexi bacterium]|nr:PIG-L family deacetylase [Chloroflexota bacterium]